MVIEGQYGRTFQSYCVGMSVTSIDVTVYCPVLCVKLTNFEINRVVAEVKNLNKDFHTLRPGFLENKMTNPLSFIFMEM
jgi:hypothetical protein